MARKRLTELRFPKDVIADVSKLVELHLRFHGYGDGRVDRLGGAPVRARRRAAADPAARADPGGLHHAERAQGGRGWPPPTTRSRRGSRCCGSRRSWTRSGPSSTAGRSCGSSGSRRGRWSARRWSFLLELRLGEGVVGRERAAQELLAWAEREGIAIRREAADLGERGVAAAAATRYSPPTTSTTA